MTDKTLLTINGLLAMALVLLAVAYHTKPTLDPADIVYQVCNTSRISDGISEQTCGELQDFYGLEFLCSANNKETNNTCWVEKI